ncbi:hypothetical protein [Methylophilus sp.]|jgi:hypothetical protein|uniref:hypothetical protein n=1 Tax=Methylophilus sp. TaxID=29541 RepID=UPI0040374412
MQQTNVKTVALSTLFVFLGFVSRDLNAHHQRLSLHSTPQKPRTFAVAVTDLLYAEPTLTIRKLK